MKYGIIVQNLYKMYNITMTNLTTYHTRFNRSRASLGANTVEQMDLKHWLRKGWLDQLNVNLPLGEGGDEAGAEIEA
jgi:hypothetical protein